MFYNKKKKKKKKTYLQIIFMKNDSIHMNLTMRDIATLLLQHQNILTGSSQQRQFQRNRLLVFSNKFCEVQD
jgi:hypothetical protein